MSQLLAKISFPKSETTKLSKIIIIIIGRVGRKELQTNAQGFKDEYQAD